MRPINTTAKKAYRICGAVLVLGVVLYPIVIAPMIDSSGYKQMQSITRQNIDQSKIQPGNMKIWSDPFDRREQ